MKWINYSESLNFVWLKNINQCISWTLLSARSAAVNIAYVFFLEKFLNDLDWVSRSSNVARLVSCVGWGGIFWLQTSSLSVGWAPWLWFSIQRFARLIVNRSSQCLRHVLGERDFFSLELVNYLPNSSEVQSVALWKGFFLICCGNQSASMGLYILIELLLLEVIMNIRIWKLSVKLLTKPLRLMSVYLILHSDSVEEGIVSWTRMWVEFVCFRWCRQLKVDCDAAKFLKLI